jgi:hypothetical protein
MYVDNEVSSSTVYVTTNTIMRNVAPRTKMCQQYSIIIAVLTKFIKFTQKYPHNSVKILLNTGTTFRIFQSLI